jgi:hypothetical protein
MNKLSKILIAVILILAVGVLVWIVVRQYNQRAQNNLISRNIQKNEDRAVTNDSSKNMKETSINLGKCGIEKKIYLLNSDNFDIFGGSTFDSVVCGYKIIKKEKIFDNYQDNVYFRIVEFSDNNLKKAMNQGAEEGNSINSVKNGDYDLNLGCLENGKIIGKNYEDSYLDDKAEKEILNSSIEKPISIILSFGIHTGTGCKCCNLAHKIRVVE